MKHLLSILCIFCSLAIAQEKKKVYIEVTGTGDSKIMKRLADELSVAVGNREDEYSLLKNIDSVSQSTITKALKWKMENEHLVKLDQELRLGQQEVGQFAFIIETTWNNERQDYSIKAYLLDLQSARSHKDYSKHNLKLDSEEGFEKASKDMITALLTTNAKGVYLDAKRASDTDFAKIIKSLNVITFQEGTACPTGGVNVEITVTEKGDKGCITKIGTEYVCEREFNVSGYKCGANRKMLKSITAYIKVNNQDSIVVEDMARNRLKNLNAQCRPVNCSKGFRKELEKILKLFESEVE